MPTTENRAGTARLLVALHDYVQANAPRHPVLLPAVPALLEAVRQYRRGDLPRAHEAAISAFGVLQQARAAQPDLPVP